MYEANIEEISMKRHILTGLAVLALAWTVSAEDLAWKTDLDAAKKEAKKENKMVLMNFTGSDWCIFCKKLEAEVFNTKEFAEYAKKNLVLVELDFPRKKQQAPELKEANAKLQKEYGVQGFPTIVALNSEGKEIWKNPGYVPGGPKVFIGKLEQASKK